MKWKRQAADRDCASQPLAELIRGELDKTQCERLAEHLDGCEPCRQQLTALTADPQWWLDAGRWLDPVAGGTAPFSHAAEIDFYGDNDWHESDPAQELLAHGLLEASDQTGCIGKLGRYEVQSVLGVGGTGIVLKANDVELNRTVAIKVLAPGLAASGAARRRFAREGQAVAAVAHENVIAVHQVEGGGRLPFLVMQFIDGDSLQDLVLRVGPLDVTTALRMTAQIASALSAAHDQGLVHRDVKPANILVGAAGQRVWITDFGLARAVDDASLTRTGFIAGTPHYMSPEQARGEAVRASSDLFGLGSVLYFMLTGRPPFRADRTLAILSRICNEPHRPVREVNPDVPPAIADLVDRLLSKSADDRIADASTVRTHCLHLLAALAEPDGDLGGIELEVRPSAHVESDAAHDGPRHHSRYRVWAVLFLASIGLSWAVRTYVDRTTHEHTDPPGAVEDLADTTSETNATQSEIDVSEPTADPIVATETWKSMPTEVEQRSPVAPVTAESSDSPRWHSASPIAATQPSAVPASGNTPPPSIGSPVVSPPFDSAQTVPKHPPQELIHSAGSMTNSEEAAAWANHLSELQKAMEAFATQIAHSARDEPEDGTCVSPLLMDPFCEELRRLEDGLRRLDPASMPAAGPSPLDQTPPDGNWRAATQQSPEARPSSRY